MWQLVLCSCPTNCLSTYAKGVDLYMANVTYSFSCLNGLHRREEILVTSPCKDHGINEYVMR